MYLVTELLKATFYIISMDLFINKSSGDISKPLLVVVELGGGWRAIAFGTFTLWLLHD